MVAYAIFSLRCSAYASMPNESVFMAGTKKYITIKLIESDDDPLEAPGTFWFSIERSARMFTGHNIENIELADEPESYLDVLVQVIPNVYLISTIWLGKRDPIWLRVYTGCGLQDEERATIFNKFLDLELEALARCNDDEASSISEFWVGAIQNSVAQKKITESQSHELVSTLCKRISIAGAAA